MDKYLFTLCCILFSKLIVAQNNSVAFVIDTTNSTNSGLHPKAAAISLLNKMTSNKQLPINKFTFVSFNDTDFGPMITTTDPEAFNKSIHKISVTDNRNCSKMSLSGINLALNEIPKNSYVYVFTDALAQDEHLLNSLLETIRIKNIQVLMILSTGCYKSKDIKVYESIAQASSGQIFELEKMDISVVQNYIESTMVSEDEVNLDVFVNPPGFGNVLNISVDSTIKMISVNIVGTRPEIKVTDPNGVTLKKLKVPVDLDKMKVVNIVDPEPGTWTISVGSSTKHSVKIEAISAIKFDFAFFKKKIDKIADQPIEGEFTYILVKIIDDDDKIGELEIIEIIDESGKILFKIPIVMLEESLSDNVFRTTEELLAPSIPFSISIKGFDKSGNPFRRLSKTMIKTKNADFVKKSIFFEEPIIHDLLVEQIFKNEQTAIIYCKATGIPEPTIHWVLPDGERIYNKCNAYIIRNITTENEGSYLCIATNSVGQDEKRTKIIIENAQNPQYNNSAIFYVANIIWINIFMCLIFYSSKDH